LQAWRWTLHTRQTPVPLARAAKRAVLMAKADQVAGLGMAKRSVNYDSAEVGLAIPTSAMMVPSLPVWTAVGATAGYSPPGVTSITSFSKPSPVVSRSVKPARACSARSVRTAPSSGGALSTANSVEIATVC
jgi:hypothetical protein